MTFDPNYVAVVINSTIRMTTPTLFVALGSALCSRAKVFNVALEGQMLVGAFSAIVANYATGSVPLSILAAIMVSMLLSFVVGFLQVQLKGSDMVVGTSVNLLASGATTFLLYVIFGVKGVFTSTKLVGIPKIRLPLVDGVPVLGTIFSQLTLLDYLSVVVALGMWFFLFRTVAGFRLRAVGMNQDATVSLGINAIRTKIAAVLFSGVLCGIGGSLLTLGQVTLYTENITAGRGFFAMAAASLGRAHPLGVVLSCFSFGFAEAIGFALQNSAVKSQLTMAIPYIVTVVALSLSSGKLRADRNGI